MKHVKLYTDGACLGNPGPGGWCCLLRAGTHQKVLKGGEAQSTNNRMEIKAVLEGLRTLKEPCIVEIHSDSQYVLKAITDWLPGWIRNGWKNSQKKPVANAEMWQDMVELLKPHHIRTFWIKGHSGHPENEFCDVTARSEAELFTRR
ncbi:MAG: ribonuclease HI [Candidatus Sericytochromatia bacterium]